MNSVYIISFFLLSASFCTAIKERSQNRWRSEGSELSYLVLLTCPSVKDEVTHCSGSIPTPSTVLSYCPCSDPADTKAYAGVRCILNATENPEGDVQLRKVTKVETHPTETELKVYYVSENWDFNEKVASIKLHLTETRRTSAQSCEVLGFASEGSARMMNQTIGGPEQCNLTEAKDNRLYSKGEALSTPDRGGPAVCSGVQWGISVAALEDQSVAAPPSGSTETTSSEAPTEDSGAAGGGEFRRGSRGVREDNACNTYVKISFYRDWLKQKTSSGTSIHRHSKNICKCEVLGLLLLSLVISLLL